MSSPTATVLDLTSSRPVSLGTLVRVELRKMIDTRAGRWLLIATAALTGLVMVIQLWVGVAEDISLTFRDFMAGMNTPMGILLPVLGIMSVTSEFSQRTALVTFTQVPSRSRVIASKYVALLAMAAAALVVGFGLACVANLVYGALSGQDVTWGVGATDIGFYYLLHAIGLSLGFAYGLALINTAVTIVCYFVYSLVLPGLMSLAAALLGWFRTLQPWVDFTFAQQGLASGSMTGEGWAHLLVSGTIWLLIPALAGVWRVLRTEVK